jgi:hypothetical protein
MPTSPAPKKHNLKRNTPTATAMEPFKVSSKPVTRSVLNKSRIPLNVDVPSVTPTEIGVTIPTNQLTTSTVPSANSFNFVKGQLPNDIHAHAQMPEWISNIYKAIENQKLEFESLRIQQAETNQLVSELHETRAALIQANALNADLQTQIQALQKQLNQQPNIPQFDSTSDDVNMDDQNQGTLAIEICQSRLHSSSSRSTDHETLIFEDGPERY